MPRSARKSKTVSPWLIEEGGKSEEFKIVSEDSEAKPQTGVAKARKLVLQDEVDAYGRHRVFGCPGR